MKTKTKNTFLVAFAMIIIGVSLLIASLLKGGFEDAELLSEEYIIFASSNKSISNVKFKVGEEILKGNTTKQFAAADIDNLVISIGGSDITLEDSEDEYIYINITNMDSSQIYTEGKTLYVTSNNKSLGAGTIVVSIPASKHFGNATLEIGASAFSVENISCDTLDLEIGAGDASISSLTVSNTADIDLGAGNLTIEEATIKDLDADLGLGNLDFTGIVSGNIDADCGMGNATFNFNDASNKHNLDLSADMGNISINGEDFGGFDTHRNQNNNSDSLYTMECGMGNIDIYFAN